jgi:hypothetical protein
VIARLKAQGLDIGEDLLMVVADALIDEAVVEVEQDEKKWNDFAGPILKSSKGLIKGFIDKFDGKVG